MLPMLEKKMVESWFSWFGNVYGRVVVVPVGRAVQMKCCSISIGRRLRKTPVETIKMSRSMVCHFVYRLDL